MCVCFVTGSVCVTVPEGGGRRDSALQYCARRALTRKVLLKRVPLLAWLPRYDSESAVSDLVAGVTVGLTVIPQGIAYATVAGIPPQVSDNCGEGESWWHLPLYPSYLNL